MQKATNRRRRVAEILLQEKFQIDVDSVVRNPVCVVREQHLYDTCIASPSLRISNFCAPTCAA
jgi:hypothetical protein